MLTSVLDARPNGGEIHEKAAFPAFDEAFKFQARPVLPDVALRRLVGVAQEQGASLLRVVSDVVGERRPFSFVYRLRRQVLLLREERRPRVDSPQSYPRGFEQFIILHRVADGLEHDFAQHGLEADRGLLAAGLCAAAHYRGVPAVFLELVADLGEGRVSGH